MTLADSLKELPKILRTRVSRDVQDFSTSNAADLSQGVLATLPRVWACSRYVTQQCLQNTSLLGDLSESGDLERRYLPETYTRYFQADLQEARNITGLYAALRHRRNREMVRIAWRDLAGWAGLEEALDDLTGLAEAAVGASLEWLGSNLVAQPGQAQWVDGGIGQFVVLGMGKLGGGELNYSSDIDLVFAHEPTNQKDGEKAAAQQDHYTRLAQALIRALSERTSDGYVFRVDTLLRPFGNSGPLVAGFGAMEQYYLVHGREWERYALIKARPVAGNLAAGARLLDTLRPFVYRRYLDFSAFEALRQMKAQIELQESRKGNRDDVKLGKGGIREIEFIVQLYQLVRGGNERQLQDQSLRPVLLELGKCGHLPAFVVKELDVAYEFLRRVENRLQAYEDKQVHELPVEEEARSALALGMGFEDWNSLRKQLDRHRRKVRQHFELVFAAPQGGPSGNASAGDLAIVFDERVPESRACEMIVRQGLDEETATDFVRLLHHGTIGRNTSARGRQLVEQLLPSLLGVVRGQQHPRRSLLRVWQVIEAIARRVTYLSLLVENPTALSQLVKLCAASPWITQQLAQQPILLDELLDPRVLYRPPRKPELRRELGQLVHHIDLHDIEAQMDQMRHFRQINMLRVASADISGSIPLMEVSDHLTEIAEVVVEHSLAVAWQQVIARHGRPSGSTRKRDGTFTNFAVVAYGKFGGIELGYSSDLDLVFVHSGQDGQTTDGKRPLELPAFYTRVAQKMIHLLSTRTPAGIAYNIDMDLRPSGQSGLLVTSLEGYRKYQMTQAWTWEHQALIRARSVAGDTALMHAFEEARHKILLQPCDPEALRADVISMRERMYQNMGRQSGNEFDVKHGRGGMIDIEFIVQYAVLRWAHTHPGLVQWPDNIRQLECISEAGLIESGTAEFLAKAYRKYRRYLHACALQEVPALARPDEWQDLRTRVTAIWQEMLADKADAGPDRFAEQG